jgi:flagellar biogenesis protein FliO
MMTHDMLRFVFILAVADVPAGQETLTAISTETQSSKLAPVQPPPSAYDRMRRESPVRNEGEKATFMGRIMQSLLALGGVVAVIYLLGKLAAKKIGPFALSPSGKHLKVLERVQLDAKNAVCVVAYEGGRSWLLGTGEGGVSVLSEIEATSEQPPAGKSFVQALQEGKDLVDSSHTKPISSGKGLIDEA